jgi:hypothetical protein
MIFEPDYMYPSRTVAHIAIEALVLGGPEVVRVVLNSITVRDVCFTAAATAASYGGLVPVAIVTKPTGCLIKR